MKKLHLVIATLLLGSFSLKAEIPSFKISADTTDAIRSAANKGYAVGLRGMAVASKGLILVPALSLVGYMNTQKKRYAAFKQQRQLFKINNASNHELTVFLRRTPNHIAITTTHLLAMHYLNKLSLFLQEKADAAKQAKTA
jgi:hypothetical protein